MKRSLRFNFLQGHLLGGMLESAASKSLDGLFSRLPLILAWVVVILLAAALAGYGREISVERVSMSLRNALLGHVLRLPVPALQRMHSGNLLMQFTVDSEWSMQGCDQLYEFLGIVFVGNVVQIVYIFTCSWALGWITLGVALMALLFNGGFAPYLQAARPACVSLLITNH